MNAAFQSGSDVLANWRDDVLSGNPPTLYPVGTGELERLEIGPGLVTLFGGAPGAGKTAFTMQLVIDALRATPTLRAVVCNIEMPPNVLFERQLARLSGIDLTAIRRRRLTEEHSDRVEIGMNTLDALANRLAFLRPPFNLDNVAASADEFGADVLLLDYIQRIPPPGEHGDRRGAIDKTMDYLRQFADAGVAVLVVAAVSRSKDSYGRSTYGEGLNLASFRESSELEFGADDAFILVPEKDMVDVVTLLHLKSRHGEATDIPLRFERRYQRFSAADSSAQTANRSNLADDLADLWDGAIPAADEPDGDE